MKILSLEYIHVWMRMWLKIHRLRTVLEFQYHSFRIVLFSIFSDSNYTIKCGEDYNSEVIVPKVKTVYEEGFNVDVVESRRKKSHFIFFNKCSNNVINHMTDITDIIFIN